MRLLHVVGARPQFVKLGPVARAVDAAAQQVPALRQDVVHTGQHYDPSLSGRFFDELGLPRPAIDLGVGSGSHGVQTGRMLAGLEQAMCDLRPSVVVVYGDTNSSLAGALAAAKLGIPVAHVEAGLRSFNRAMPEEINRVATDHVCDLLLAPTDAAMRHLEREGLAARATWVGDVMADAVLLEAGRALQSSDALSRHGLEGRRYALATLHRAESTTAAVLPGLMQALSDCARHFDLVLLPMHPRTEAALRSHCPEWRAPERLKVCAPLGHPDMLRLVQGAEAVLTDSGGLQKEAFLLGTPCLTLRTETEWVESVAAGGNVVAGVAPDAIAAALTRLRMQAPPRAALAAQAAGCYGAGQAARRIVTALIGLAREPKQQEAAHG